MIVILQKDLKGTGKAGDVVKVSDGYARNMLIPRGIAKEATEAAILPLKLKQRAEKAADCLDPSHRKTSRRRLKISIR